MNAIMVCVDYADILAITLPYNRHHFDKVGIVTDFKDQAVQALAENHQCELFVTDSFYSNGATFNKWIALEQGIDHLRMRNCGWLCLMDADVLWPKSLPTSIYNGCPWDIHALGNANIGKLWSPLRRMWNDWPNIPRVEQQFKMAMERNVEGHIAVSEQAWNLLPIHRNIAEWAGYSQIFHTSDSVLGPAPWHQTDWKHAGGADSFFQQKWAPTNKVRPPFEVLHLGPAGQNWYGRATPLVDGSVPEGAEEKREKTAQIWRGRSQRRSAGLEPFGPEKIPGA